MVEPSARFEELQIPLAESVDDLRHVSAVLGIPQWWPTGSRVGVVLAHGRGESLADPLIEHLQRELTERRYLTLRFNFPFAEQGKRGPDPAAVLRRTYQAAIAVLGRDPTAAPAHLFLGGKGVGAQAAAALATRLRLDGLFFLGFPLHPQDKPEKAKADDLYRIISPMLFVQGTRDRYCDLDTLRQTLSRVGAPIALHVAEEADHRFKVLKKSLRRPEEVHEEVLATLDAWMQKVLES